MQRIISIQASHSDNSSTEFVTKRLCCSIVFTVAFFSLVGGFFLGRYATDRTALQQAKLFEDIADKVALLDQKINSTFENGKLACKCDEPDVKLTCNYDATEKLRTTMEILETLGTCFR